MTAKLIEVLDKLRALMFAPMLLLVGCLSPVVFTVQATGDVFASTDLQRAIALGEGTGRVDVRFKGSDIPASLPYAVSADSVWLFDGTSHWTQPKSETVPSWVNEILSEEEIAAQGLVVQVD